MAERLREENRLNSLRENLQIMEDHLHKFLDPREVPPQMLFNIFVQGGRVETNDDMKPIDYLKAISLFTQWYAEKGIEVPNKDWVKETKEYWTNRVSGRN